MTRGNPAGAGLGPDQKATDRIHSATDAADALLPWNAGNRHSPANQCMVSVVFCQRLGEWSLAAARQLLMKVARNRRQHCRLVERSMDGLREGNNAIAQCRRWFPVRNVNVQAQTDQIHPLDPFA